MLGLGNPAAKPDVQNNLKASTEEQLHACITAKQAVSLFLPKILLLTRFLNRKIAAHTINPCGLFILARDQAFFKTEEIPRFSRGSGLLFNHVWGKTLTDSARHLNPELCRVKAIETFVAVVSELRISVTNGYLFRPTSPQGHIVNNPLESSTADERL